MLRLFFGDAVAMNDYLHMTSIAAGRGSTGPLIDTILCNLDLLKNYSIAFSHPVLMVLVLNLRAHSMPLCVSELLY
jgi:hypothetical protein